MRRAVVVLLALAGRWPRRPPRRARRSSRLGGGRPRARSTSCASRWARARTAACAASSRWTSAWDRRRAPVGPAGSLLPAALRQGRARAKDAAEYLVCATPASASGDGSPGRVLRDRSERELPRHRWAYAAVTRPSARTVLPPFGPVAIRRPAEPASPGRRLARRRSARKPPVAGHGARRRPELETYLALGLSRPDSVSPSGGRTGRGSAGGRPDVPQSSRGQFSGHRDGQVVQRRQGLRLHHAR